MRQIFKHMCLALIAMATIGFAGCNPNDDPKPPVDNPDDGQLTTLANTSWVGIYNDTYMGYPAVLTWNLDYLTENTGELYLELVVAGQDQQPYTVSFTYTFTDTTGHMSSEVGELDFTYSPEARTITMFLQAGDDNSTLGGETVFHPRDDNPSPNPNPNPGEITEDFPALTEWAATQNGNYHLDTLGMELDLPMVIVYTLSFNNDHTGQVYIDITLEGTDEPQRTQLAFTWTWTEATRGGDIVINGAPLPYTISADNNTLVWQANLSINGGNRTGEETTVFTRTR